MGRDFVHLHVHTAYSLLDGAARVDDLMKQVKKLGQRSVAITDHGNMYGVIEFYKAAQGAGVHPVIGCEVYVANRTRFDRQPRLDDSPHHLVLLAKDQRGYQNLIKLVSKAFLEGFYYRPRVDWDLLQDHSEGLIALSACLGGQIPNVLLEGQVDQAKELAIRFNNLYGQGNFYLELQEHGLPEQRPVNESLVQISRETGIPLAITNDTHYVRAEDHEAHDVLLCIQTGKSVHDTNRMRFVPEFHLKSADELEQALFYLPSDVVAEAMDNTVRIAEQCEVHFEFGKPMLPVYEVPEGYTAESYLEQLCEERLTWRYPEPTPEVRERLNYELSVINRMGFASYFLIVQDFINYARQKGIPVGIGRGSGAGSIVAYVLGITGLDPLPYGLVFERFLNVERVSMPDFDTDFCYERRGEVIDYVTAKYGSQNVCQIITFGTMGAKAAVRDVSRALGLSFQEGDRVAKLIPQELDITIKSALEKVPELAEAYQKEESTRKLLDIAIALEGLPRHASVHAAAVVITPEPLEQLVPLAKSSDDAVTTQFPWTTIDELGLLKMDFLGLRTLTVIEDTVADIKRNHGVEVDLDSLPFDDPQVYELLSKGETLGVFQLEGSGMRNFMRQLKPSTFEDIIAGISLFRPGPMDQIPKYIENKNNPDKIRYVDKRLESILGVTYGCLVYQEQVQQIVRELAGYSLGRADLVRRAMAKKKPEVMELERKAFIHGVVDEDGKIVVPGAIRSGVSEEVANTVFDEMAEFAKYAFNKSHAACYAVLAYHTAWLKTHYRAEFMAALLTSVVGNSDKVQAYIEECRRYGLEVTPPDVNNSREKFAVTGGNISFGLSAIKNVGYAASEAIVTTRAEKGPFTSLYDLCEKVDLRQVNKRVLDSLIKCGALTSTGAKRAQLLAVLDECLEKVSQMQKSKQNGQLSLFDMMDSCPVMAVEVSLPEVPEFTPGDLLAMEKELLGVYVSGHPLDHYRRGLKLRVTNEVEDLLAAEADKQPTIGGLVVEAKRITTKTGKPMMFFTVEDFSGQIEVVLFPEATQRFGHLVVPDKVLVVTGRTNNRDDSITLIAESIVEATPDHKAVVIMLTQEKAESLSYLKAVLGRYPGSIPLYLNFTDTKRMILADEKFWCDSSEALVKELAELFGQKAVVTSLLELA